MKFKKIITTIWFTFFVTSILFANAKRIETYQDIYKLKSLAAFKKEIKKLEKKQKLNTINEIRRVMLYNHMALLLKNEKFTAKTLKISKTVYQKNNNNPVVIAYYGSSLTLMSRDGISLSGPKRLKYYDDGLTVYGNALSGKYKNNVLIRMFRAKTCYKSPSYLKKIDIARIDYEWLVKNFEDKQKNNNKYQTKMAKKMAAEGYYTLGDIYRRMGQTKKALAHWKKAAKISPESKWAKLANENIDMYNEL